MKKLKAGIKVLIKWTIGTAIVIGIGSGVLYVAYATESTTDFEAPEPRIIEKLIEPTYSTDEAIELFTKKRDAELDQLAEDEKRLQKELDQVVERQKYLNSF